MMELKNFKWKEESKSNQLEKGIEIYAPAGSNYFVNPADGSKHNSAPYFYEEVEGDFVFKAKVNHDFLSLYDACVLLAYDNETLWAKACFEYTDINTHSVVTVMTNELSDDANGYNVDGNEVWLQIARKNNVFAIHYSLDGKKFLMSRICNLPMKEKIMVGLVAQCPMGEGAIMKFEEVSLERKTLSNIREGNN